MVQGVPRSEGLLQQCPGSLVFFFFFGRVSFKVGLNMLACLLLSLTGRF